MPSEHRLEFMPGYPPAPYSAQHWYGYAILSIGGVLYHYVSYLEHGQWHGIGNSPDRFRGVRLVRSADKGASWQFTDGTPLNFATTPPAQMMFWDEPDLTFSLLSAVQFGCDYADNTDGYVYLFAPNGWAENKMNELVLARVPNNHLESREDYEFFVSRTENGKAKWSRDLMQRAPVLTFPLGWVGQALAYSWHPYVVYIKPLKLYLLAAGGTGKNGSRSLSQPSSLAFYTAEAPWGPWRRGYWNPEWINESPDDDRLYEPVIPPKWISLDGLSFYLVHSNSRDNFSDQYYRMNVQKVSLVLEEQRENGDDP